MRYSRRANQAYKLSIINLFLSLVIIFLLCITGCQPIKSNTIPLNINDTVYESENDKIIIKRCRQ